MRVGLYSVNTPTLCITLNHTHFLHPIMDRVDAMIHQHLCWPGIRNAVRKEVNNYDTCKRTKRSNIKYVKLPAKEAEVIPWKNLCISNMSLSDIKKGK